MSPRNGAGALSWNSQKEVAVAFGRALRATRTARGLTHDQLSEVCDFYSKYQSLLERGLRRPTVAIVLTLANGLGVAPARLVTATVVELRRYRRGAP
jgi:transcriptional regulator with XRE-family HTH domain